MVLDDVTLTGTAAPGGLGAQWNMTNGTGTAAVDIVNSHTSGGGNFYVSGFDGVTVQGNTFDGQGIALNGVDHATVTGNTFQNIGNTFTAERHAASWPGDRGCLGNRRRLRHHGDRQYLQQHHCASTAASRSSASPTARRPTPRPSTG